MLVFAISTARYFLLVAAVLAEIRVIPVFCSGQTANLPGEKPPSAPQP